MADPTRAPTTTTRRTASERPAPQASGRTASGRSGPREKPYEEHENTGFYHQKFEIGVVSHWMGLLELDPLG